MKARNIYAVLASKRKAGSHRKSNKALRRNKKVSDKREYSVNGLAQQTFNLPGQGSNPCAPTIY